MSQHEEDAGYAHPEVLASTDWVAEHGGDANVRLVEVDVDTTAYQSGHIAGAVGWNWKTDTQDQVRRNVPSREGLQTLLRRAGIHPNTTVIVYGDNNNWFAAFAVWLLKYYGHADARLMNGGRAKWIAEGRGLTTDVPEYAASTYAVPEPDSNLRALRDYVLDRVNTADAVLVDVRSPKEFSGELLAPENLPQEGAQRGGHIAGAVNIPWGQAVREDSTFKTADELRALYGAKGVTGDKDIIAYCRIGERSAHTWFVLKYLLGYENVRNYDGSWTEWGSLIDVPIEK